MQEDVSSSEGELLSLAGENYYDIKFEVEQYDKEIEILLREKKISDNFIYIDGDITGDGRIDKVSINIEYDSERDKPELQNDKETLRLIWPFDELETFKVGDIDSDRDADIVLNEKYILKNVGEYPEFIPYTNDEFEILLKDINDLVIKGEILEAYKLAFELALGSPHNWTTPGEGTEGRYDREPDVRFDIGNCVTWVEKIMAMVNSGGTYDGFYNQLINIRYLEGQREYAMRNHFQSADWIPNNIKAGYIKDILEEVLGYVPYINGTINKKEWYASKSALEGDFEDLTEEEIEERVVELKELGAFMGEEKVKLGYYPFEDMIVRTDKGFILNETFVSDLPEVTIFNVVYDGVKIKDKDDNWMTDIIVIHLGFIVKDENGELMVIHSTDGTDMGLLEMTEEKLTNFLENRYVDKETKAKGLHLSKPLIKEQALNNLKRLLD